MEDNDSKRLAIPKLDGPRALRPEEYASALRLVNSAFRPDNPNSMEAEFSHVLGRANMENMRVIVKDGEVVSHTAIYLSTIRSRDLEFKMGGISAVATHPDYRGKGLASGVMRDCVNVMREKGCHFSFLWSDLHAFYGEFGYEPAGSFYLFKPTDSILSAASSNCEIVPYTPDRLPEIIHIHDREVLRTERSAKEYETYFSLTSKTQILLAIRDGQVSAYAAFGKGRDLHGFIHDWGGEPQDLLRLAQELLTHSDTGDIYVLAPTEENEFTSLLTEMDAPKAYMKLVMLSIIDVEGLSTIVSGYLGDRLGMHFQIACDTTGIKLEVGQETTYIEPERLLSSVMFGPEPPSTFLSGLSEDTLTALDKVLPIPLFIWGLDWV